MTQQRRPVWKARASFLTLALAGLLVATTGITATAQSPSAAGGTLVAGITSDVDQMSPWKATQFQAVAVLGLIYGTLTELDQNLNVVPGLAKSWESSADGKTLTFHLRDGVTFHSGAPLTSADVKASLDAIMDEANAAVARSSLASVTSVDAPDPMTVVLNLSGPDAGILAGLSTVNVAILPAADIVSSPAESAAPVASGEATPVPTVNPIDQLLTDHPDGTGPFMFVSRTPNESITLAANPNYWGDPVKLAGVEFRIIPDESSIVAGIQAGNVNFGVLNDPVVAQQAEADGVSITRTPQLSYHVLQLNANVAPLNDLNVRLAIQCAIDRQTVLDTAALGEGEITGPITSPAYKSDPNARPCPTRDLDKAKSYLAAAGHADGLTINTIVSQGEYATAVNEAQAVQAQLADAGITLNIETMDIDTYVQRWLDADFQTAIALNGGRPDPDGMYGRYFTSTGNLNKVAGFSSPQLDQLFAQGKATIDPAARKPIYDQISKYLEDNAVWIWLFTSDNYTATTPNVSGFIPMANNSLQYLRQTTLK
jgi:peptide/nickel transport system substrate-binding protein